MIKRMMKAITTSMVMAMVITMMILAMMMTGRFGGDLEKVAAQVLFSPDLSSLHKPKQICLNLQNHWPDQRFRLLW